MAITSKHGSDQSDEAYVCPRSRVGKSLDLPKLARPSSFSLDLSPSPSFLTALEDRLDGQTSVFRPCRELHCDDRMLGHSDFACIGLEDFVPVSSKSSILEQSCPGTAEAQAEGSPI